MKTVIALIISLALVGTALPLTHQPGNWTADLVVPVMDPDSGTERAVKKSASLPDLSTPEARQRAAEAAQRGELALTLEELRVELARLRKALEGGEN